MITVYTAAAHRKLLKAHKAATTVEERNRVTRELLTLLSAGGNAGAKLVLRSQVSRKAAAA